MRIIPDITPLRDWIAENALGLIILIAVTAAGFMVFFNSKGRRWAIAFSMALLFSAAGYGLARFTNLPADILANIWVAAGTLLLGVITAISVYETTAVIKSEDKRHMQDHVPLLLLTYPTKYEGAGQSRGGFALTNIGKGIALKACACFDMSIVWRSYETVVADTPEEVQKYESEGYAFKQLVPILATFPARGTRPQTHDETRHLEFSVDAVADRMDTMDLWIEDTDFADRCMLTGTTFHFSNVQLTYTDMFNNPYKTLYTEGLTRYQWGRPDSLR